MDEDSVARATSQHMGLGDALLQFRFTEPPWRIFTIDKGVVDAPAEEYLVTLRRKERPGPHDVADAPVGTAWSWTVCLADWSAGGGPIEGDLGISTFRTKRAVYGVLPTGAVDVNIAADNEEAAPVQVGHGLYLGLAPIGQAIIITFRDAEGAIIGNISPDRER